MIGGIMSFNDKTVAELKKIAKVAGVSLGDAKKKSDILDAFDRDGLTEEKYESMLENMYQEALPEKKSNPEIKDETKSQLLMTMKHDRAVLTALGYRFTKEEPYVLVNWKDAEVMKKKISHEIREASPEEVASFYGAKK